MIDLKKRMKDEREKCKDEYLTVYATCRRENERDMMHAEEIVSRYGQMNSDLNLAI